MLSTGAAAAADLARRQHGALSRADLRRCGLSDDTVDRLARGALLRRARGVYELRSAVEVDALPLVAAALCVSPRLGHDAVVAGLAAARVWRLPLPEGAAAAPVEVLTTRTCRLRESVTPVHVAELPAWVRVDGVPVTRLVRTVGDVVRRLPPADGDVFLDEVLLSGRTGLDALRSEHAAGRGRRGNARLGVALRHADPAAQGPAERALHAGLRRRGLFHLGRPQLPLRDEHGLIGVGDWVVEALHLVLECQGYAFYSRAGRFRADIVRRGRLRRAGYALVEIAAVDVLHRLDTTVSAVHRDLLHRAAELGVDTVSVRLPPLAVGAG